MITPHNSNLIMCSFQQSIPASSTIQTQISRGEYEGSCAGYVEVFIRILQEHRWKPLRYCGISTLNTFLNIRAIFVKFCYESFTKYSLPFPSIFFRGVQVFVCFRGYEAPGGWTYSLR